MIASKKQLSIKKNTIPTYLYEQKDALFFDIETTGLFWKNSHLYLIGVVYFEDGQWILQQWFLDRPTEEVLLLQEFSAICKDKRRIIHYNGNGFDIPYLQHKYNFYQIDNPMKDLESLDLYRTAKPFQKLFGLTSVKQKDVERFLNIRRNDTYSGGELIQVYSDYLETQDENLLSALMLHNLEDVQGLIDLLPILGYDRMRKGSFTISNADFTGYTLSMQLLLKQPVPKPVHLSCPYYELHLAEENGKLQIYGRGGTMKHFFPDYKDYYYLPLEDQAIHKSVGAYVDSAHREKARASNCYQKSQGTFLPQLKERFKPEFYEEYKSKPAYFSYKDDFLQDMQNLHTYACDFLSDI